MVVRDYLIGLSDRFTVTRVASEMFEHELTTIAQPCPLPSWLHFHSRLLCLSETKDRALLVELRPALDALKVDLQKKAGKIDPRITQWTRNRRAGGSDQPRNTQNTQKRKMDLSGKW